MAADAGVGLADALIFAATGRHLSDLQRVILQNLWQRGTYSEIAGQWRYTEGHVKDVASQLWRSLSAALDEPITKSNCRSVLERRLQRSEVAVQALSTSHPIAPSPLGLVGRAGAIADLTALIQQGQRAIVLQGEGGIGKTTLAQDYVDSLGCERVLELLMAKETAHITPVEQVVEEWLRQDFQSEPGRDFGVTLDRLKRHLRTAKVGVLIDNLEPALDGQGRFWAQHSRYGDLLRVLCDPKGQTVTLLTSRDRLCEPGIPVAHYRLPGLAVSAWQDFFDQHGITIAPATLQAMHHAYGGNAKAMTILCGAIQSDFEGDGDAYWQENGGDPLGALDLKNLVGSQVQRLKALDADAYRVFCRLGVYRFQDVPRLPAEGLLAQMGDIPTQCQRPVIASLRNRSLLEGHKGEYWLHPVVQAEALHQLHQTEGERTAHQQAAAFWSGRVKTITTPAEALQTLEGYYHRRKMGDYAGAAAVLLHSRPNQWGQYLTLGSTLYRMGLLQSVLATIPPLLPNLPEGQQASELRNILADVYWISGQIHAAIATQRQAQEIADRALALLPDPARDPHHHYCLKMLAVDALLSLGLYHLDLWDLAQSAAFFQQAIAAAEGTAHQGWADKASLCLALVTSYGEGNAPGASSLAEKAYRTIAATAHPESTGRFAFFLQLLGQTYANLGDQERSAALYQRAIAFAEESHYVQVKAKALLGLGELARQQGDGTQAIAHIQAAIALLAELGARSDLAEAHYQLGITHREMQTIPAAQNAFQQAIQHFTEIQAPQQVAKVQAARPIP